MVKCELLLTTELGQKVAVELTLEKGTITGKAFDGHSRLLATALEDYRESGETAEVWMNDLPKIYNGSYLRARIVEN